MNQDIRFSELKSLNNESLLHKTETLVREERRITTGVLQCLREVEARMLYAELGYSSLHEFCTKHLHYSEGSAHRRISSMRLIRNLPEQMGLSVENKINAGTLTLTNLSSLQSFLKIEKKDSGKVYSVEEKVELIAGMENQSKRTVEKKLAAIQPKVLSHESERVITEELTEIKFVADETLMLKLKRVREVSAHQRMRVQSGTEKNPPSDFACLLHLLTNEYLKKHDPMVKVKEDDQVNAILDASVDTIDTSPELELRVNKTSNGQASRYIPAGVRQKVWQRDGGKCTYTHHGTQQKCNSKFGLEIDHRKPFVLGGTHELKNLRLLCRQHNLLHAKRYFG